MKAVWCLGCSYMRAFWPTAPTADAQSEPRCQRVRCDKGHWQTRLGDEKTYPLATAQNRRVLDCPDYDGEEDGGRQARRLHRQLHGGEQ